MKNTAPFADRGTCSRNIAALDSAKLLTGPGPKAANSFEQPDLIKPQPFEDVRIAAGRAEVELPPLSVAAMTFV